jgi:hypothetical protein
VGVLGHGLLQTVGDSLAHGGDRDVLVGGSGGGRGGGLVLLDILLGDDTTTASTLEALDGDTLFEGEGLGSGADGGLTLKSRLELLTRSLGLLRNGLLRGGGRSGRLSALGLLLLLSGGGLVTTGISQSEGLEGGDIGTLLNKDGNGLKGEESQFNARG